jgi:hypothetical protein
MMHGLTPFAPFAMLMRELRNLYIGQFIAFAVVVALVAYYAPIEILPRFEGKVGKDSVWFWLASHAGSRIGFLVIFSAGAWCLRSLTWKWVRPSLNFSGRWKGTSTYSTAYLSTEISRTSETTLPTKADVETFRWPAPAQHSMVIEQDCFHIRITPTESAMYANWESFAADLLNRETFAYAYRVNYKGKTGFPSDAYGYEELKVVERAWGRPKVLSGHFWHCARGQNPIYGGTVRFERD